MLGHKYIEIDAASWMRWLEDPVTQAVFTAVQDERDDWARRLLEGDTLTKAGQEVAETAKAVGVVYGCDILLIGLQEVLREQWEEDKKKMLEEAKENGY